MAISETSAASNKRVPQACIADKPVSHACFSDWRRFCFVLREIASGESRQPLSGLEAQKRAQAVLNECGYAWPSRVQVREFGITPNAIDFGTSQDGSLNPSPAPL
jgi:hypothetical protein